MVPEDAMQRTAVSAAADPAAEATLAAEGCWRDNEATGMVLGRADWVYPVQCKQELGCRSVQVEEAKWI